MPNSWQIDLVVTEFINKKLEYLFIDKSKNNDYFR